MCGRGRVWVWVCGCGCVLCEGVWVCACDELIGRCVGVGGCPKAALGPPPRVARGSLGTQMSSSAAVIRSYPRITAAELVRDPNANARK